MFQSVPDFGFNPVRVGVAVAAALALLIGLRARKRPRVRNSEIGVRHLVPLVIPVLSVLLIAAGVVMVLDPFVTQFVATPAVPVVVGVFLIAIAGFQLIRSFRFYLEPHADFIAFRQAFGPRQVIRYEDIAGVDSFKQYDREYLAIVDAEGTKLKIDLTLFTVDPLIAHLEQLEPEAG